MNLIDRIKNFIRKFVTYDQNIAAVGLNIHDYMTRDVEHAINLAWYSARPDILSQTYKQIETVGGRSQMFWSQSNSTIRQCTTGVPRIIVDTLADIVRNDFQNIAIDNKAAQDLWNDIEKDNDFQAILKNAIKESLIYGEGAFKISADPEVSEFPVIEFFSGDNVELIRNRGRVHAALFKTQIEEGKDKYTLVEHYGEDFIDYKLYNEMGYEVSLDTLEETKDLVTVQNSPVPLFVPFVFNPDIHGVGQSLFSGKYASFDGLDETYSQWLDALRKSRVKTFIPESLLPRDRNTGEILKQRVFQDDYMIIGDNLAEAGGNVVQYVAGTFESDMYHLIYVTALDMALQGLISPSTLGIDMKKLDNAEAQREKEKATLYTRDAIIAVLEENIPLLVKNVLAIASTIGLPGGKLGDKEEVSVNFGEYANPSFEAVVETISKARAGGIMSVETAINQMYAGTWTDKEIEDEIERLKDEESSNTISMFEPATFNEFDEEEPEDKPKKEGEPVDEKGTPTGERPTPKSGTSTDN